MKGEHKVFNIKKFPMDVGRITYGIFRVFTREKIVKMPGFEKVKGAAVIVANHTGFSDPHTVGGAFLSRRVHFMASEEIMGKGLRRACLRGMGCISVNKNAFDLECIKKCIGILNEGYMLAVFPQGGIVKTGEIDAIKSGAALLACKGDVPIIPMYIRPGKGWLYRRKVVIGENIDPKTVTAGKRPSNGDLAVLTDIIQNKMIECEKIAEEMWGV